MNTVRIGLIGSGFMGKTSAETVSHYLSNAKLVAIAGGSRAPGLAAQYQVECESSVEELVSRDDIDAVIISTPHAAHVSEALAAARAGKHILLDKPMATTTADSDRIIEAARAANVNLMIMFGQRFRVCNIEARRLVQEGRIGKVKMIQEQILATGGLASLPAWQSAPENCGIFVGHAVHNIDRIRWISGAEIASVSAHVQRDPLSGNEVSTMALLSLTNGAMATIWASWDIASPAFPRTASSALIAGETGNIDLDAYGELRLGTDGSWNVLARQDPIDWAGEGVLSRTRMRSYQMQDQEFVDSILEHRTPSVTGEDGRAAVEVAVAAYRSAAEDRTIQLRPLEVTS